MNHRAGVTVDDAGHVVKRATDIQIGHVDMPMLMRGTGLIKPFALGFRLARFAAQEVGSTQHAVDGQRH